MNVIGKLNGMKTYLVALAGLGWAIINGDAQQLTAILQEAVPWIVMLIMRVVTRITTDTK